MYRWVVFLHVFSAFLWILAHGIQAAVMLQLRGEADPERSLTLFNVYPSLRTQRLLRLLLGLVVAIGLIAGFMLPWWRQGWMWAALVLLVAIGVVMVRFGGQYFDLVHGAANRAIQDRQSQSSLDAFHAARAAWHPIGVSIIGLVGLAVILWLMMFKPF